MKFPSRLRRKLAQLGLEPAGLPEAWAEQLSQGDLTTLLLAVFQAQAQKQAPHELFRRFADNRFVQPSQTSPIELKRLELNLLERAQNAGFEPVELSPVAPLGSCSSYGKMHQNKVLSGLRSCEVVADPSNMLALLLTRRWQENKSSDILRLCTAHRCLRTVKHTQPQYLSHFGLFALASLVPHSQSHVLVAELERHLAWYAQLLRGAQLKQRYTLTTLHPAKLADALQSAFDDWEIDAVKKLQSGTGEYYWGGRILLDLRRLDCEAWLNLADCGIVDWPAQLSGHRHLKLVISGLGLERLLEFQAEIQGLQGGL